ncbi:Controls the rotational direction of flagella during chemotaxis [Vibrio sp. B1FLJ16]|nr:Controls the rotational direction of flagella during chemotaxis [Vibrio sp. B1FLJ16]CAE6951897.1 Controls the rotational direction of flagella during chemotaxis [Vibrio sp. B1FLJ16]
MSKKQLLAVVISVAITSVLVSAGTFIGGLWFLTHSNQSGENKEWLEGTPLSFLTESTPASKETESSFHSLEKIVLSVKGKKQSHFVMLEVAIETRTRNVFKPSTTTCLSCGTRYLSFSAIRHTKR